MIKKIIRHLSLALVIALALCPLAQAQEDQENVLAIVNGTPIAADAAKAEYEYYAYLYQMYGLTDGLEELKLEIARYYVDMVLLQEEFDRLGLTIDEEAIRAEAQESYAEILNEYIDYLADESKTDEENRQSAADMLSAQGFTEDELIAQSLDEARVDAVMDHYTADFAVTEQDIQDLYDAHVSEDQELYQSDPAMFESAMDEGSPIFYAPEGFRAVKHILVLLDEEDQDRSYELMDQLDLIEEELTQEGADVEALNEEKAEAEAELDEIFASIEPTVQEIQDRLAAGEDFLALMDEYGEDPGMQAEPYATNGYLVYADSETWIHSFRDAAMALEKPGDVSGPVRSPYGIHLIRFEREIPAGATPLDDVRALLSDELMENAKSDAYAELVDRLYEEADVMLFLENLDDEENLPADEGSESLIEEDIRADEGDAQ